MAKGIIFLYIRFVVSVQTRKGWVAACAIRNLCCASVLNDTRAEGEA